MGSPPTRTITLCVLLVMAGIGIGIVPGPAAAQSDAVALVDTDTPDDVVVGEPTPIELTVANNQDSSTNVTVQATGATTHTVTVELRANAERTVTLEPEAPPKRGPFDIAIILWEREGGAVPFVADRLSVEATTLQSGSQLAVRPLTPMQAVAPGEPATVGFEIINQGDTASEATFDLAVDGDSQREISANLPPGESSVKTTEVTAPEAGERTVTLSQTGNDTGAEATVTATDAPVTASIAAYNEANDQLILKLKNTREAPTQAFLRLTYDPGVGSASENVAEQAVEIDPAGGQRVNVSTADFEMGRGYWILSLTNLIVAGEAAETPNTTTHSVHDTFVQTSDTLAPSKELSDPTPTGQSGGNLPLVPLLGVFILVGGVGSGYVIGSRFI